MRVGTFSCKQCKIKFQLIGLSTRNNPSYCQYCGNESVDKVNIIWTELIMPQGLYLVWCHHRGTCYAVCPMAPEMDYSPRQILRLLQLGMKEEVLQSRTIWLCSTCATCTTRCPREVDLARLMECLRHEAKSQGLVADKNNNLFFDFFLLLVKWLGRTYEGGLIVLFNIFSWQPFKDVLYAPLMLYKGKIKPFPHRISDAGQIRRIYARSKKLGGEKL